MGSIKNGSQYLKLSMGTWKTGNARKINHKPSTLSVIDRGLLEKINTAANIAWKVPMYMSVKFIMFIIL